MAIKIPVRPATTDPARTCRSCKYGDHLNCPAIACACQRDAHRTSAKEVNDVTYKIVRFFKDDRPREVQQTGLSLEDAQAHCQDPSTHGEDWFDGYEAE